MVGVDEVCWKKRGDGVVMVLQLGTVANGIPQRQCPKNVIFFG